MRYLNEALAILTVFTAISASAADFYQPENYDLSDSVQDDVAREQWSMMRDQPELNDTSGTQGTFSQFIDLAFSKKKPSKADLERKQKKAGVKKEKLDQDQEIKSQEPATDAKIKSPDEKTKVSIPVDKNKALSSDGSTKSAY
jgi:hypothetical protein